MLLIPQSIEGVPGVCARRGFTKIDNFKHGRGIQDAFWCDIVEWKKGIFLDVCDIIEFLKHSADIFRILYQTEERAVLLESY